MVDILAWVGRRCGSVASRAPPPLLAGWSATLASGLIGSAIVTNGYQKGKSRILKVVGGEGKEGEKDIGDGKSYRR